MHPHLVNFGCASTHNGNDCCPGSDRLLLALFMLSIKDNGAGFDPSLRTQSTGLVGMKERAESIVGKLLIKSKIGKGTQITFAALKKMDISPVSITH